MGTMGKLCRTFLVFALIIVACTPSVQVSPTAISTITAAPSTTPLPTATKSATPTPMPMIEVDGLKIPDPKASNPELFDLDNPHSPIPEFIKAMKIAGVEVTSEQILDAMDDLSNFQSRTDANGKQYFLFSYTVTQDEIPYSTGFIYDEQSEWKEFTLSNLGRTKNVTFGTEGSGWLFGDPQAAELVTEQVDLVVPSDSDWADIEPVRGKYNFHKLDRQISVWNKAGKEIRAPGVLFQDAPNWLEQGNYSKEELTVFIREYITALINHGKEKGIKQYIIVNEPYLPTYREDDFFYKVFGGYDYIEIAFEAARKADPSAILIYNDTDNHDSDGLTTPLTRQIVERLKSKSLIDAVGIQGHLGDWVGVPNYDDMKATLQSYGIPVIVTEFDYHLGDVPGTGEQREIQKALVYQRFLRVALEIGITDFTFWGLDERNSWLEKSLHIENADPTMFNKQLEPGLAYYAVLNVLAE
jgi:endo-1,4-beta-xylanase